VVFILFLGGTISQYLAEKGDGVFVYDFDLLGGMSLPSSPFNQRGWRAHGISI
jgi:hypothetical protein